MTGMTAFLPLQGELHRRLADRVGLLDIHFRCDVARGALQIVGDGPMELVAERLLSHLRHHRSDAAQLGMTECILGARLGEKFPVGILRTPSETTITQ